MSDITIGVIGATGLVGTRLLEILYNFGYKKNLRLSASDASVGTEVKINECQYKLNKLSNEYFDLMDVVFFCADTQTSLKWVPIAQSKNVFVIDNSCAFRMYDNVPLVIPEINGNLIETCNGVVANPNCCTALLCMVLFPLLGLSKIERIDVSTYQAVSGAGNAGIGELVSQCNKFINNETIIPNVFPSQIFGNCFSHNTPIDKSSKYNDEELKIINETKKILDYDIKVSATCVRVPVFTSHSESVKIVFENPVLENDIIDILENFGGIKVMNDIENNKFPEPVLASNNTDVFVGRIRKDYDDDSGKVYHMFICGDQLLKGASFNAFQIFQEFEKLYLKTNNNQESICV